MMRAIFTRLSYYVQLISVLLTGITFAVEPETQQAPSANFYARHPNTLILHYTEVPLAETLKIFCQGKIATSHYTVDENGNTYQHVDDTQAAKHAGTGKISYWHGYDVNSRSVGIEIVNLGFYPNPVYPTSANPEELVNIDGRSWFRFNPIQIQVVINLCQKLIQRWNIPAENILAHSDVAPWRDNLPDRGKIDPGPLFPWIELARQGIGITYDPEKQGLIHGDKIFPLPATPTEPINILWLQDRLSYWGYQVPQTGELDPQTCNVIRAFRMHYLGEYNAQVDPLMVQILEGLIQWRDGVYRGKRRE